MLKQAAFCKTGFAVNVSRSGITLWRGWVRIVSGSILRRTASALLFAGLILANTAVQAQDSSPRPPQDQAANSSSATGQANAASLEGEWRLCFKGKEVEVGHWPQTNAAGQKVGGREVRGPYQIAQNVEKSKSALSVTHGSVPWLVLIPNGPIFHSYRTAEGFDLGPELGLNNPVGEIRVRPSGNELEIWKRTSNPLELKFVFSDYTLVRSGRYSRAGADAEERP